MMKTILRLKQATKSLFIRLLISFMAIILLLVSFNFLSFTFFRNHIHEEIIRYNNLNLKSTSDSYETHIQFISNMALSFYLNDRVQIMIKNPSSYVVEQLRKDIRNTVTNQLLYLDNLILYFQNGDYILEKEGSSTADKMFGKYYVSQSYPLDFWKNQFASPDYFRMHPAAEFNEATFKDVTISKGLLFPLIIKNKLYPDLYMIAMIDANKMFSAFHRSINNSFYVLDSAGRVLYSTVSEMPHTLPALSEGSSYIKEGQNYYFYYKAPASGLTYVNIIPDKEISSTVSKLNFTLITLLLISIAIGVGASVLFSMRFNNPVKKIIDSIRQLNTGEPAGISHNEFEQINSTLNRMLKTNNDITQVLNEKTSLLRQYAYMNKLKDIHTNFDEFKDLIVQEKAYRFVLFQLFFTSQFHEEADVGKSRATYFLREIIRQYMSTNFKEAHTVQVETDQIMTVVFSGEGEPALETVLESLKEVFVHDKQLIFMTIALSPVYEHSTDFTSAYEKVLELTGGRLLNAETQIIEQLPHDQAPFVMTASQEQEFEANLKNGNASIIIPLAKRIVGAMYKKSATAAKFRQFAEDLIEKVLKTLVLLQIDYKSGGDFEGIYPRIRNCQTLDQLEALLEQTLGAACRLIQERKEQRDPMTAFVLDYLETHYHEDITLDSVADKLDISGGYLSTYFKEKTGKNFIDYVHEIRIGKAKDLLLRSDLKIQDAAAQVGYHNLNSFNRMFKKYVGMTPSEFRRGAP